MTKLCTVKAGGEVLAVVQFECPDGINPYAVIEDVVEVPELAAPASMKPALDGGLGPDAPPVKLPDGGPTEL